MKNTILTLSIMLLVFMGISCKKSSNTTSTNKTNPPSTTSTGTVNVQVQWLYGINHQVPENQMWYKINNGSQITLSTNTAVTYTSTPNSTVGQASLTLNIGDVIVMGGVALNGGLDKFTFNQTNVNSTQMITNGVVTGTVSDNGHDTEYTTTAGTTTFSFTTH